MRANVLSRDHRHAVVIGLGLALVAYFAFALNDALGKYLVVSFGVAQLVLIRSIGGLAALVPLLVAQNENPLRQIDRPKLQILRALLATVDTGLFYAACVFLPLADVMTFYMAGPIYTTVASHFLLGEHVAWRRWTAILVGFSGVLIALQPSSDSFSLGALFAVAGSVSYSLALVINKKLENTGDASLVTYQTTVGLIGGGLFSLFDWRPLTLEGVLAMLLLGIIGTGAHLMLTRSVKLAPVSVLAPIQYTLLLWGIILGAAVFGDVPSATTLIGSGIIVLAGIFIFHRKSMLGQANVRSDVPTDLP